MVWLCRIGMKWQNRKKKYTFSIDHPFHACSPTTVKACITKRFRVTSRNFRPQFRHDAMSHGSFSPPPAIVFVRYGARISVEIYPRSRVLMYSGILTGTSCWELSCHGIDGREMMDSVKLNDGSWHLFLTSSFFHPPLLVKHRTNKFLLPQLPRSRLWRFGNIEFKLYVCIKRACA